MADRESKSSWPFFAFGVGTALAIGVLGALWMILRKLSDLQEPKQLSGPSHSANHPFGGNGNYFAGPVHFNLGDRQALPSPLATMAPSSMALTPPAKESRATTMTSFTLRASDSTRLFTATKHSGWRVEVTVVGPPGTFALLSMNQAQMSTSSFTGTMTVPAGATREIFLAPKDVLYGQGNIDGVFVSIAANPSTNYG